MKNFTFLLLFLAFSFLGISQQTILTDDYDLSFDNIAIQTHEITIDSALIQKLDQTLLDEATASGIKGIGCAFNFPNNEVWKGVFGYNTKDVLINKENSFGIGSVTKSITSACILKLVEENLVALDDTIGQWIAPNPNIDPSVTIRQCLNHTSGIADILTNQSLQLAIFLDPAKRWDPKEILANYVPAPLFDKGTSWTYSNTNYLIAGLVIEGVTGQSYIDVVREKVLDPIGLTNIQLFPYETLNTDFVSLWNNLLKGKSLDGLFSAAWAAGAFVATPEDISIWMKKLAKGEVLTKASMDEMLDFVVRDANKGYGLGIVQVKSDGYTLLGHNGDISYKSSVYYFKELDLSVAIHTNDGNDVGNKIRPILTKLVQTYVGYLTENEDLNASNFKMYPNPVSNRIMVDMKDSKQAIDISILNTMGQTVAKFEKNASHFEIPVDQLMNGQYILRIKTQNGTSANMFIKQ